MAVALSFSFGNCLQADLLIDLEDAATAAMFDSDTAGSTAGPFSIDGNLVTFATVSVSGFVDTSTFGLGINNGGGDPDTESFNIGESWTLNADTALFFTGLELGGLQSEETFGIRAIIDPMCDGHAIDPSLNHVAVRRNG